MSTMWHRRGPTKRPRGGLQTGEGRPNGNLPHRHNPVHEEPGTRATPSPTSRHHPLPPMQSAPRLQTRPAAQQRGGRPHRPPRTRGNRRRTEPHSSMPEMQPERRRQDETLNATSNKRRKHRLRSRDLPGTTKGGGEGPPPRRAAPGGIAKSLPAFFHTPHREALWRRSRTFVL